MFLFVAFHTAVTYKKKKKTVLTPCPPPVNSFTGNGCVDCRE